jgi:hypothetical protein
LPLAKKEHKYLVDEESFDNNEMEDLKENFDSLAIYQSVDTDYSIFIYEIEP